MSKHKSKDLPPTPPKCSQCGRDLVPCLWSGVQGWLCAWCAAFWRAKAAATVGEAGKMKTRAEIG